MADKDFKVKTGLDLPAPLPVTEGGTGQTTVENTRNAIMPAQVGHSGKFITTDGTSMTWAVAPQQTATDGAVGYKVFAGNTTPTGQNIGDIWIDGSTGNGIQLVRWRKTIAAGTSTISGLDDNNLTLTYTAGNEQVYINGTLITRGQDYTATNGTSISLTQAVEVGDTVEIFGNPLFSVTDTYTQSQANNLYVAKSEYDVSGKNYCINGGFDIWQRGTSGPAPAYLADRWFNAGGNATYSQESNPINLPLGFRYGIKMTMAATDVPYILQAIETSNSILLAGKRVVLSYYVSSTASSNCIVRLDYSTSVDTGVQGSFTQLPTVSGYSSIQSTTTNMTRVSAVYDVPSTTKTLRLVIGSAANITSGNSMTITGIQLEIGSVPTSFSRAGGNIQGELDACQRYFVRYEKTGGNQTYFLSGQSISTTRAFISLPLPVNMRTSPSISRSAGVSIYNMGSNFNITTLNLYQSTQNILNLDGYVSSGLTNNTPVMISLTANGDYLDFSAEL